MKKLFLTIAIFLILFSTVAFARSYDLDLGSLRFSDSSVCRGERTKAYVNVRFDRGCCDDCDDRNVRLKWYLDGDHIETEYIRLDRCGGSETATEWIDTDGLSSGTHRVKVVAEAGNERETASKSFRVERCRGDWDDCSCRSCYPRCRCDCYRDRDCCDLELDVSTPSLTPSRVDGCGNKQIRATTRVRVDGNRYSNEKVDVTLYVYRTSSKRDLVLTRSKTVYLSGRDSKLVTFYFDADELRRDTYYVYAKASADGCNREVDWSSYSKLYVDGYYDDCRYDRCDDCYDPCDYDDCKKVPRCDYDDCRTRTSCDGCRYTVRDRDDYYYKHDSRHYEPPKIIRTVVVTTIPEPPTTTLMVKQTSGYVVKSRSNDISMDELVFWIVVILIVFLILLILGMIFGRDRRFQRTRTGI